jgi:hypothetical protein
MSDLLKPQFTSQRSASGSEPARAETSWSGVPNPLASVSLIGGGQPSEHPREPSELELAISLTKAAQAIVGKPGRDATAEAISQAAATCLPDFDHISLALTAREGGPFATTTQLGVAQRLDALQVILEQGPFVEVMDGATLVSAQCLQDETRWGDYVSSAVLLGVRSQVTVALRVPGHGLLGVLNLYSTRHDYISESVVMLARLYAIHAALALHTAQQIGQLEAGLSTRSLIGQAMGLLMARRGMTPAAALAHLTRLSSQSNVKLRDIASRMVTEASQRVE